MEQQNFLSVLTKSVIGTFRKLQRPIAHLEAIGYLMLGLARPHTAPRSNANSAKAAVASRISSLGFGLSVLLPPTTQAYASTSSSRKSGDVQCFFVPGYRLDSTYYESFRTEIESANKGATVRFLDSPDFTTGSINDSAALMVKRVKEETAARAPKNSTRPGGRAVVCLMGHSRGAAVAALALLALVGLTDGSDRYSLIMIDPVDDANHTVLQQWRQSPSTVTVTALERVVGVFVLALSYGGFSKYYHTTLESACAPAGRNSHAFVQALPSPLRDRTVVQVYADAGHMQVLTGFAGADSADGGDLPYYRMCAWNPGKDRAVEARQLLAGWVSRSASE